MTSKTISQIAEELGVSRQAVHQKLKKTPELQKYTETSHGTIYVKGEGIALLKNTFAKSKKTDDLQAFENNNTDLQVEDLKAQIAAKNNEIAQLKQRLEDKETQIQTLKQKKDEKDEKIQALQNELTQELQKSRDIAEKYADKFAELADHAQHLNAADKPKIFSVENKAAEHNPTLWERLTGKGRKQ